MKNYIEKNAKYITYIICIIVLSLPVACILIELGNIITVSVMNNAFNEVRDYVSFRLTHFIMEGINPYSFETIQNLSVPFFYLYGALYPLTVAGLCKATGMSIIAGFYFVNICLVCFTTINIWLIVKESFKECIPAEFYWISFICVAINVGTFFTMFRLPVLNFRGDVVGIYISSLIFLILYKNKEHVFCVAFLTVMLFFAKQIMLVMGIPILIFYMLVDKKLAKKYIVYGMVIGIGVIVILQLIFPLYLNETIVALFGINGNYGSVKSSIYNLLFLVKQYCVYCIAIICGSLNFIKNKKNKKILPFLKEILWKKIKSKEAFIVFLWVNIIMETIFLLYFAKCDGDGYKYCQDMLAANIFILGIYFLCRYCFNFLKKYAQLASLMILCIATTITFFQFSTNLYFKDDVCAYYDLNAIISEHKDELMYLGINSEQYLLNEDIWECDNIYFNDGQVGCLMPDRIDKQFSERMLYDQKLRKLMGNYANHLNELVANKSFGLVTTCAEDVLDMQLLEKNYYKYATYTLKTETLSSDVIVWLPLK